MNVKYIDDLCFNSRKASQLIASLTTVEKNNLLMNIASSLRKNSEKIIEENKRDLEKAEQNGVSAAFYDRLLLNRDRIEAIAASVEDIAALDDPVGRVENMKTRPSGIRVGQMRVPVGVVAVIYESRPNVTIDIAALCIKSGNCAILRGGEEALYSNMILSSIVRDAITESGYDENIVTLVSNVDRELVPVLLKKKEYIDIVIPRGGEGLIRMVTEESMIPVIKHEKGICHLYIDKSAQEEMANGIAVNAKVQRPGVCNSVETILIHRDYMFKESLILALIDKGVEVRGCEKTLSLMKGKVVPASGEDWDTEYLDLIVSVRIVDSFEEAVAHIRKHSSGHSEAIVTSDYFMSERFLKEVDSAAVLVNASTRFHDGGELGLGAEVGISTQKLHARGAMGIEGLTTLKYIVYGNGQIR